MLEVSHDYTIYVGSNENYIVKAQTFSRDNALLVAQALSVLFPNSIERRLLNASS